LLEGKKPLGLYPEGGIGVSFARRLEPARRKSPYAGVVSAHGAYLARASTRICDDISSPTKVVEQDTSFVDHGDYHIGELDPRRPPEH
jgi:hypothetical protein